MIDIKGRDESRFWWAWGRNPASRFADTVFFREIDPPYRVGTGIKFWRLHLGWVTEWRDTEEAALGARYWEDVEAEILGRWGTPEDQPFEEAGPEASTPDVKPCSPRVGRDDTQRLSPDLPAGAGRFPTHPRPLRDRRTALRNHERNGLPT